MLGKNEWETFHPLVMTRLSDPKPYHFTYVVVFGEGDDGQATVANNSTRFPIPAFFNYVVDVPVTVYK